MRTEHPAVEPPPGLPGVLPAELVPTLTRADVAALLHATERQVARWTAQRRIAVVHLGTSPRYTPRAVADFLAQATKPAEA